MDLDARTEKPTHLATLAMTSLATVAVELAMAPPETSTKAVLARATALLVAPTICVAWWIGRRRGEVSRRAAGLALVGLMLAPIASGAAWSPVPLEVGLMASLRNLGLGLATLAIRPAMARLAALVSLFLAMVAASVAGSSGDGRSSLIAIGAYSVVGAAWLMLTYWQSLAGSIVDRSASRSRFPFGAMLAWASAVSLAVVGAVAAGPTRSATVLAEWMASSGGTGDGDPDARSGVNDGDNEVDASDHPSSLGFTQSEVYLESDRPSLYDSFTDQYGEPIKPKGPQGRMVSLPPQGGPPREHPTENLRAGRTFSAARKAAGRPPRMAPERSAEARLYVKGETPLHLGLLTFDRFDGVEWHEEPHCRHQCPLERAADAGAWLRMARPRVAPSGRSVGHQIKIGTLDSSTLPIPAHPTRLRVGSVDRPEFFCWAQPGLIRMVGRTVPGGTVIDTESSVADPSRLRSTRFASAVRTVDAPYLEVPKSLDPRAVALARSWAEGRSRGWEQVEAVVDAVRGRCVHDRGAAVDPPGLDASRDVVGPFLLETRRGPDYLFSTAAAVSLRLLGYPCRVVSGYYAPTGREDPRTRHTALSDDDVHFWVEVLVPGETWAVVDPTPGFEVMSPAPSMLGRVARRLALAWQVVRAHPILDLAALILVALGVHQRRRLLDLASTMAWGLSGRGDARARALKTLWLIESRSGRARLARPPGRTPERWYRSIASAAPAEVGQALDRLVAVAGWARHAPASGGVSPWSRSEIEQLCRAAARAWTLDRFLSHRRSNLAPRSPS